jgi:thioredoxin 1
MLVYATDATIKEEIKAGISVVDFYADWCGPCKMIAPILEQLGEERQDFKIVKIDVDANQQSAMQYGVRNIPTLLIVKDGVEIHRQVGFVPKPKLVELINASL